MSAARRLALILWAWRHDSLVIEDDYDAEFRYGAPPLPALAGLAPRGHVIYIGSFSKVLTPALRIDYVIASPALRDRIAALKPLTDYHSPWPVQVALAAFLTEGHLTRHVRKMRRHSANRRATLLRALALVAPLAHPIGIEAGLHVCLELAPDIDAERVATTVRNDGVVQTLKSSYHGPPDRQGLILGYGGLTTEEIEQGAAVIVSAIQRVSSRQERAT